MSYFNASVLALVTGAPDTYSNEHPPEQKLAHQEWLPWSCTFSESRHVATCGFYMQENTAPNYMLSYQDICDEKGV